MGHNLYQIQLSSTKPNKYYDHKCVTMISKWQSFTSFYFFIFYVSLKKKISIMHTWFILCYKTGKTIFPWVLPLDLQGGLVPLKTITILFWLGHNPNQIQLNSTKPNKYYNHNCFIKMSEWQSFTSFYLLFFLCDFLFGTTIDITF